MFSDTYLEGMLILVSLPFFFVFAHLNVSYYLFVDVFFISLLIYSINYFISFCITNLTCLIIFVFLCLYLFCFLTLCFTFKCFPDNYLFVGLLMFTGLTLISYFLFLTFLLSFFLSFFLSLSNFLNFFLSLFL
jgi:hypothetical protein